MSTKAIDHERILKLRQLINDYRYHYHVLNESIISEEAADSLKHELSQLEQRYPELITPDSPTQRVAGAVLDNFTKYTHSSRMLSLNDVFSIDEIKAWINKTKRLDSAIDTNDLFIDIKMDGLACALIYQDGLLVIGATRGDGFVGEDVTSNIRTIESIPLTLRPDSETKQFLVGRTEIRGEIVMYKQDFANLNKLRAESNLPLFANPRNTAAGTIRQLDSSIVSKRKLYFRAYDLIRDDASEITTNLDVYRFLNRLGLITNPMAKEVKTIKEIESFINKWRDDKEKLEFNSDGLVIKLNKRADFLKAGIVGKAPRGAVAYKFAAEQSTTKLKDIIVSIGRTGVATPVAVLEPVLIDGSQVSMATLHNFNELKRKDIRINDTVIVHKAGDIIPAIIESIPSLRTGIEKEFIPPSICPECGKKLIRIKESDVGLFCTNKNCPARTWKRIVHFASKDALDIEGLGEKNVIALITACLINDPADIYNIKYDDLIKLDRFADKSATNLIKAINDKRNPPLANFIYGLGIKHVGSQTAFDLAKHFKSIANLSQAKLEDLLIIDGIGQIAALAIVEFFQISENTSLLQKFVDLKVKVQKYTQIDSKLINQSFVITGTLKDYSRDQAANLIRSLGGTFQSSVSIDTSYLVIGDKPGQNKVTSARKYHTKIINEQELKQLLTS